MKNNYDKVINLYKRGLTIKDISRETGIYERGIYRILKKSHIERRRKKLSSKDTNTIIQKYKNGLVTGGCFVSCKSIASEYGIDTRRVKTILRDNSLPVYRGHHRKVKYNQNYFDKIDTRQKAKVLGWMYSDGSVSKHGFYLEMYDKDVLKKFKKELQCNSNIWTHLPKNGKNLSHRLSIKNVHMVNNLIGLGVMPNKSKYLKWPLDNFIPENLMTDFIGGCYEGDGGYYNNWTKRKTKKVFNPSVNITSTKDFCEGIATYIEKKVGIKGRVYPEKRSKISYYYTIGGMKNCLTLLDWIYHDPKDAIFMDRKYNDYLKMKKIVAQQIYGNIGKSKTHQRYSVRPIQRKDASPFVVKHHYTKTLGPCKAIYGLFDTEQKVGLLQEPRLVGVITYGNITYRYIAQAIFEGGDHKNCWEFTRMAVKDDCECPRSFFVSQTIKLLRKEFPEVKCLVSFADLTQGHYGYVYQASNWIYCGQTGKSYHYIKDGQRVHKRGVFNLATKCGIKEREYAIENEYKKIKEKPKFRYVYAIDKKVEMKVDSLPYPKEKAI